MAKRPGRPFKKGMHGAEAGERAKAKPSAPLQASAIRPAAPGSSSRGDDRDGERDGARKRAASPSTSASSRASAAPTCARYGRRAGD